MWMRDCRSVPVAMATRERGLACVETVKNVQISSRTRRLTEVQRSCEHRMGADVEYERNDDDDDWVATESKGND